MRLLIGSTSVLTILGIAMGAGCKEPSTSEFLNSLASANLDTRTAELQSQLRQDIEGVTDAELVAIARDYFTHSTVLAEELLSEYEAISPPSYLANEYANFVSAYSELIAANHRLIDELRHVETRLEVAFVVISVLSPSENNFIRACFALQEAIDRDNVYLNCGSGSLPASSPALISLRTLAAS